MELKNFGGLLGSFNLFYLIKNKYNDCGKDWLECKKSSKLFHLKIK
jgi:hypothetical protein